MTRNADTSPPAPAQTPIGRPDETSAATGGWWRQPYPWFVVLGGLVAFNLVYALPRYLSMDPAQSRSALDPDVGMHFLLIVAHAVTGNIAMVTVFLQLWPWLRRHHPRVHRISGRVYVFAGVLPSAGIGLIGLIPLRPFPGGSVGLAAMGVLWIVTTGVGLRAARRHRYAEHRRWMVYSFALAMGTSWGRVIVMLLSLFPSVQVSVDLLVEMTNWLGWVVNLLVAHWWLENRAERVSSHGGQVVTYPSPLRR